MTPLEKVNARVAQARRALVYAEKEKDAKLRSMALRDLHAAERRQRIIRKREAKG